MRADICILLSSIIGLDGACVPQSVPKTFAVYLSGLVLKSMHLWIQVSGDAGHQNAIDSPPWPAWFGAGLSCSVWSAFFPLRVCHCLAVDESNGARTMSGSWEVCLYPGQHNLFLLKTEILREVPRVPSKFRIWREREEGGNEKERKSYPFSCRSPLEPLGCQEMHSNSIWNTNEIKGSSPPAGERTDQWMLLCTEGATERRLRENERAVSGPCGNRRTEIKRESHWFRDGVQNGILTNRLLALFLVVLTKTV